MIKQYLLSNNKASSSIIKSINGQKPLMIIWVTLLLLVFSSQLTQGQITVSENGRYLLKPDGSPFLWLGDTGWGLFQKLNREEADLYLKTRANQGFSIIHAVAAHKNPFIVPELENIYGDIAFSDEKMMLPALTEGNDPQDNLAYDYWDHVDYIIDQANEYGINIVFLPVFGMAEGETYNMINPSNAYNYGKFLGNRYKGKTNIIWCMGGDVLAENEQSKAVWNLLAKGITESIAVKEDYSKTLMTYHVRGGHSSSDYFENAPWIDFHMIQTWDSYTKIYSKVSEDYHDNAIKPVLHGEGAYEDGPEYPTKPITPHKIRNQAYWATFAGGMHTYGNTNVWSFGTNPKYVSKDWKEAIFSEGAKNMSVYYEFFQSIDWWDFAPDQSIITEGIGSGEKLNVAMSSSKAHQILVYLSSPTEVSLDIRKLGKVKKLRGVWINPQTGKRKSAGKLEQSEEIKIISPKGWDDALLLLGEI